MEGKRAVKIDFNTKLKIIRAHEEGKSAEDIADELNIPHVVYVERVLEKKHELQALSNSIPVTPTSGRKRRTGHLNESVQSNDATMFTPRQTRRTPLVKPESSGTKRKREHDPEPLRPSKRTPKIEVMDFDEEEEQANANSDSSETEDYRSRVDAAANTTFDRNDRSMLAQVQVADMAVSPFRTVKYSKDKGSQTAKQVFYDEEYVAFLKNNHEKTIFNKDSVIDELKRQNFALSQQVDKLQEDLIREREKKGLEGGWKKYF